MADLALYVRQHHGMRDDAHLGRLIDAEGHVRAPFIYPLRLVDRLERRYEPDRTAPVPLGWNLRAPDNPPPHVWLPLGGDALGRDVLSRLLLGGDRLARGTGCAIPASGSPSSRSS